ncbi:MAG TPA: prepilin-type N-terminal cleavage/methylation domain-containing protein [Sulfurovum sp.]|nr:prepilin-type N-terminal cleavage/methylation domain-containing protein [Sulfurovum sp.]
MTDKREKMHKGFTLIELLIVIIIISLVYFLGFSNIEKSSAKAKALTPLNLKSNIMKSELFLGEGTLLCIDECRSCYFRKDVNNPFEVYENRIDLYKTEAYTLDAQDNLLKMDYGRYQDEKVCLVLHFYPNESSTQIILKQQDDVYFLPAFFDDAQKIDSLEEAKALWLKNNRLVKNSGDFY